MSFGTTPEIPEKARGLAIVYNIIIGLIELITVTKKKKKLKVKSNKLLTKFIKLCPVARFVNCSIFTKSVNIYSSD